MDYLKLVSANIPTPVLLFVCVAVVVLSLVLIRKITVKEHKKMLEVQSFALANPNQIEKIKLVDHREIYCVVTMADKEPTIIAEGVQAVRVFDQLILANPQLAK
jgi:hypothetical protein